MAWYYSFTHKCGTEDATTWQQRIRGLYPPDALFAEAGGLCVVAVAAVRRREDATHDNNQLPFDLTPKSIALLVKEPGRLLGNARLVWFEPWMLASLREGVAEVARSQEGVVDALDSLKAQVAQVLRGTERGGYVMITKSVFLIMYLWHTAGGGQSSVGGPAMTVTQVPSLAMCEKVGAAAKAFAEQQAPLTNYWAHHPSKPAEFRCIEVDDAAPQPPQVKCSTK